MENINLVPRLEASSRYQANAKINEAINQSFAKSLETPPTTFNYDYKAFPLHISTIKSDYYDKLATMPCGKLPYGPTTTLEKSGCAVFCFHHGLTSRGFTLDLKVLAHEIYKKGYYEEGKGTYHNLFDHYGLRRATHYNDIIDALSRRSISTCLIQNSIYHNDSSRTGSHFVNVVGLHGNLVVIDDPSIGRTKKFFTDLIQSISIAWIW